MLWVSSVSAVYFQFQWLYFLFLDMLIFFTPNMLSYFYICFLLTQLSFTFKNYCVSFRRGVCVLSHVWLFAALWTVTCQASLPMEFSRQEYWSGVPFLTAGDLPDPGIKPESLVSPALAGGFFTFRATWEALRLGVQHYNLTSVY